MPFNHQIFKMEGMPGMTPEGLSSQAQQIWGMLDDMAENDPAAYRLVKFALDFMDGKLPT